MGANPSPSNLLVSVVACLENTGVECEGDNGSDVRSVECALCGMLGVVPANVGVMERVAGGLGVNRYRMSGLLTLPLLDHRVDSIDEAVLRHRVEEADKVIVGRVESDVGGSLSEVAVETAPKL